MWEVVEYVYLYTLLKYKTIPMCKDTQNNLKYEEKTDVFSFWPVNSIIKAIGEGLGNITAYYKALQLQDAIVWYSHHSVVCKVG